MTMRTQKAIPFKLGYEGMAIAAFIACLQTTQVKTVVDVHELPLSRKKGF